MFYGCVRTYALEDRMSARLASVLDKLLMLRAGVELTLPETQDAYQDE